MIKFEWDQPKATANLKKHQVSFEEAKSVFYDEFAVQFFDEEHSSNEDRFLLLGMSSRSLSDFGIVGCECAAAAHFLPFHLPKARQAPSAKLLIVCHCEHEHGKVIRIISARKATKRESAFYQGG